MTYVPTGALVAAPTAALPEQEGGERNWDYRYTWVRDGSFSVYGLLGLGYVEEAAAFGAWLRDRVQEQAGKDSGPLKIMYRVDGTSDLVEETLDHFEGWPRDPMWLSTLAAMERELVSDSLVYRYNPSASPDGLRGDEGTFSLCTFWYVDALARAGRLDDARLTFEKMHTYANRLGLYSEEISSTGEQLGNFPQAFSHLSLISAAVNLDRQLDGGAG
jgi:GH15 family glucan-1,4-alpha-glucosidase